ncbi:MAG: helix-turn-helix transcriptional regulator [Clostridia bacterium]|nr:helix-turn-helix transcriptional regulator [Clostridia bacterium]
MLIHDMRKIGNKMLELRKKAGLTQAELAEKAGLSDRTYADIERGNVNMRIETLLRICDALHITPDAILTFENTSLQATQSEIMDKYAACSEKDKQIILKLMDAYLSAL